MKLTPKQKNFCDEYVLDFNATRACIRAGYSQKSAAEQGYQLLHKTSVRNYLGGLLSVKSAKLEVDADLIISELITIAFANLVDAFDENGKIRKPNEIPAALWSAISEIDIGSHICTTCQKITFGNLRRVKLQDKLKALELLIKYVCPKRD